MLCANTGGKSEDESIDGGSDEALTGAMAATIGENPCPTFSTGFDMVEQGEST